MQDQGTQNCIRSSIKLKRNPPAPLSVVRKDYKPCEDEVIGPPRRPVCGGDVQQESLTPDQYTTDGPPRGKMINSSTEKLLGS